MSEVKSFTVPSDGELTVEIDGDTSTHTLEEGTEVEITWVADSEWAGF